MINPVECADCGVERDGSIAGPCECGSRTRAIRLHTTVRSEVTIDRDALRANGERFFRKWTKFKRSGRRRIERWFIAGRPDLYAETVTEGGVTRHKCGHYRNPKMHGKSSATLMRRLVGRCPRCSGWAD